MSAGPGGTDVKSIAVTKTPPIIYVRLGPSLTAQELEGLTHDPPIISMSEIEFGYVMLAIPQANP